VRQTVLWSQLVYIHLIPPAATFSPYLLPFAQLIIRFCAIQPRDFLGIPLFSKVVKGVSCAFEFILPVSSVVALPIVRCRFLPETLEGV
jgi:hypothetical protein